MCTTTFNVLCVLKICCKYTLMLGKGMIRGECKGEKFGGTGCEICLRYCCRRFRYKKNVKTHFILKNL